MNETSLLHIKLSWGESLLGGKGSYIKRCPPSVVANLNPAFKLRDYQKEALGRFCYYWEEYPEKPQGQPLHTLLHMATGSGKTLMMAGLILYLYQKGYRHFLFFVN